MQQARNYGLENDDIRYENGHQYESAYPEWPLDFALWAHLPQPFRPPTQAASSTTHVSQFFHRVVEATSFATPAAQQLAQSSYLLPCNPSSIEEESGSEYELDDSDEIYGDGMFVDTDSPSFRALQRRLKGLKGLKGLKVCDGQHNVPLIKTIVGVPIAGAVPATGGVVADKPAVPGNAAMPDREYYIGKNGKRRIKNLRGPFRRETGLLTVALTENELREIRTDYDAHPSQSFKNPTTGTQRRTVAEDGTVTVELIKRIRVSNEEYKALIDLREKNGRRGNLRIQKVRNAEEQKAYLERNKKANERFKTRKRHSWIRSRPGFEERDKGAGGKGAVGGDG